LRGNMKLTERHVAAVIMNWCMEGLHHEVAVPGSTIILPWEADVLSVTKAGLIHEYEIKLNIYDFKADAKKVDKHKNMGDGWGRIPNYFWYVTVGFEIEPPAHAGWIRLVWDDDWPVGTKVEVVVAAPRLSDKHVNDWQRRAISRILAHRLRYEYGKVLRVKK